MTDSIDLDALEAIASAATPGPWTFTGGVEKTAWVEADFEDVLVHDERGTGHVREDYTWLAPANGAHIAAFDPATVLALIARVRDAEQQRDEAWRVASEQTQLERDRAEAAEQRAHAAEQPDTEWAAMVEGAAICGRFFSAVIAEQPLEPWPDLEESWKDESRRLGTIALAKSGVQQSTPGPREPVEQEGEG